jgi:hypothetical protein
MFQVVDVRVGSGPHRFIDEQAEQQHQEAIQAFRARIPPSVRYVVAPDQSVTGRDGRVFTAGQPITVDDVAADAGVPEQGRQPWRVLADLVHEGRVLENYGYQPPIERDPRLHSLPATATRR